MILSETKICRRCKEEKRLEDFNKLKSSSDGHYTYCRECVKSYVKRKGYNKYSYNSEKKKERQRQQRRKNSSYEKKYRPIYLKTLEGKSLKLWSSAKSRAKVKGIEFSLSRESIRNAVLEGKCQATGISFDFSIPEGRTRGPYVPSIDRIDNTKGYTEDNCWVVCLAFNIAKGEGTYEELLDLAKCLVNKDKNK